MMINKTNQSLIEKLLMDSLNPSYCLVENFSHKHNVPPGSESHFQITVVSEKFTNLKPVQKHRLVNSILGDVIKHRVHAVTMHLYSPSEWDSKVRPDSEPPSCMSH